MKIIVVEDKELYVMPDTVLLRNNEQYFSPDYATSGEDIVEGIAVKITRLAKCIAPKFAHRTWEEYYECKDHRIRGVHHTIGRCFDRSFEVAPEVHSKNELSEEQCTAIDNAIAYASTYIGLRIGDYVFISD